LFSLGEHNGQLPCICTVDSDGKCFENDNGYPLKEWDCPVLSCRDNNDDEISSVEFSPDGKHVKP